MSGFLFNNADESEPTAPSDPTSDPSSLAPADSDPLSECYSLRSDVQATRHIAAGESFYVVEDPFNAKFYRLGVAEWDFARNLTGKRSLRALLRAEGDDTLLSPEKAVALCKWLLNAGLVETHDNRNAMSPANEPNANSASRSPGRSKPKWWLNPLFINVPLFNPNRALGRMLPYLTWTLGTAAIAFWAFIVVHGVYCVLTRFDRFVKPASQIFSMDNWFWLLLAWIGLKAIHELYHGLLCKRFGGDVPRCGLMFILFSPVAFVDVSSSWRFPSKWQRIAVSAGGMYAEFFVAGIAAWIWSNTESGLANQICHNIIFMASVATLLFNGNFLMRFDGYYIVSDLVEVQNLYASGQKYLRYVARRYLLGVSYDAPTWPLRVGLLIRAYAWASLVWRMVFCVGIVAVASTLFHGAGIVLAWMAAFTWFVVPAFRFTKYILFGDGKEQPNRWRFAAIAMPGIALLAIGLRAPWPGGVSAPAVVEYAQPQRAWARGDGFVKHVHVRSGQRVKPGDVLLQLENHQLENEVSQRRAELALKTIEIKQASTPAQEQILKRELQVLNEALRHAMLKAEELSIVAQEAGTVVTRNLELLQGQLVRRDTLLLEVASESRKHFVISFDQSDVRAINESNRLLARVRLKGQGLLSIPIRIPTCQTGATLAPPHPALTATFGGTLPIRQTSDQRVEFVEPRLTVVAPIPNDVAKNLRSGELAKLRIASRHESIGRHLQRILFGWLEKKTAA